MPFDGHLMVYILAPITGTWHLYGICGSRNYRRVGRRATEGKNGNAGPKLHWRLWEKKGFPAPLCDPDF